MKAILFGSIGTLVETSEIQRKSYNLAFEKVGVDWYWNTATYCNLLTEPGGIKRIRKFANNSLSEDKIQSIHFYKEKFFTELIPGTLYLRPTVIDVIRFAKNNGIKLGFITTTSESNINVINKTSKDTFLDFFKHMLKHGIFFAPSMYEAGFISSSHLKKDFDYTIEVFEDWAKKR